MLCSDVAGDARVILAEAVAATWADADMLNWVNKAELTVVQIIPDAYTIARDHTLVANDAKQVLPASVIRMVKPLRNTGADGVTPGLEITPAMGEVLQAWDRDWMRSTAGTAVRHVVYDERVPSEFWIWPRVSSALHIELKVTPVPTFHTDLTQALVVPDEYRNAMSYLVIGYAMSKLDEDAFGKLADSWIERGVSELNLKNKVDAVLKT